MIEDRWDLLISRVPWYVPVDDSDGDGDGDGEANVFCLHVLPEVVEVEFEFEFEFGVDVVDEELVPDRLDRTGRLAFGAGVGIET